MRHTFCWDNPKHRLFGLIVFVSVTTSLLGVQFIMVPHQKKQRAIAVKDRIRKDKADAYDDTLNAECGYERGTVHFRAALRDKAKKALQEVQDEGYLSSIGSGMSIGMLGGGAGCAILGSFGGPASAIACGALGAIGGGIGGAVAGAFAHHDAISDAEDAVKSAEERLAKAQQELAACVLALPNPMMEAPSSPNGDNSRLKNNN